MPVSAQFHPFVWQVTDGPYVALDARRFPPGERRRLGNRNEAARGAFPPTAPGHSFTAVSEEKPPPDALNGAAAFAHA